MIKKLIIIENSGQEVERRKINELIDAWNSQPMTFGQDSLRSEKCCHGFDGVCDICKGGQHTGRRGVCEPEQDRELTTEFTTKNDNLTTEDNKECGCICHCGQFDYHSLHKTTDCKHCSYTDKEDWEEKYFEFKNLKERDKFLVWLKEIEQEHKAELSKERKKVLSEVKEIIGNEDHVHEWGGEYDDECNICTGSKWAFKERHELRVKLEELENE